MIYGRAGIRRSTSYSCLVEGLGEGSALAPRLCDSIGEKFLRRDCSSTKWRVHEAGRSGRQVLLPESRIESGLPLWASLLLGSAVR